MTPNSGNAVSDQVVVVTGASSGVGRACARAFGAGGAQVGLLARNAEALSHTVGEIRRAGGGALACPVDVTDAGAVEQAAAVVEERWGHIDVWVNCAMATVLAPVRDMTSDEFRRVTEVTYLGYVYGTQAALRRMLPADAGTIVQVGSALAFRSVPLQAAYCASKAATRAFTDALRTELLHDKSNVAVTQVHLPAVNTPQSLRQRTKMRRQQQPVPPLYSPESMADIIVLAAQRRPRQVLVGGPTWRAVLGQKLFPGLLDRYIAKHAWDSQFIDAPNRQVDDILFDQLPDDPGAHGPYWDREHGPDLSMRLRRATLRVGRS
jgi:NAD(P)-dependent dehydrogenase (short-subunit alcohol dehydrogenase family)